MNRQRREAALSRLKGGVRTLRTDPKLRKAVAAVALLGLVAYAVAGWKGLAVLAVALVLGAAYRPLRQRVLRWYLLA